MRNRLIVGVVCLGLAGVIFLLGYTEITFSIREDFMSNVAILPVAVLALLGIVQIIKAVRIKSNW